MEADRPLADGVMAANYIKALPPSRPFGLVFGVFRPPDDCALSWRIDLCFRD